MQIGSYLKKSLLRKKLEYKFGDGFFDIILIWDDIMRDLNINIVRSAQGNSNDKEELLKDHNINVAYPIKVKNGVLFVVVNNSCVAMHINLSKAIILCKLIDNGIVNVEDIRVYNRPNNANCE